YKVDVAEARIRDIHPHCRVTKHQQFYLPENADAIDLSPFDYVVDCIDTVTAKIELIRRCHALGVPIISCMGAANKMDATAFRVSDISKTKMDPLAKVIRRKLRQLHIPRLKCVWSEEEPLQPLGPPESTPEEDMGLHATRRTIPASNAFVPAAAGLIAGGEVVKDLLRKAGSYRITT
ncbi:MAG: ThiF family adenylyltransferase, partial [Alloprevotella sp.]|nr:ThiF family adenylyltransferase [Alloprevotella sp.]